MTELERLWNYATIKDNFIFSKTMEMYPDLCRQLLELVLNVKIKEINYPEREKTIETRIDGKGIRLDVYVKEAETNRSFDVEMQLSNSDNLAKRMRYYQGLIDMDKLKRGQHYRELDESFVIFICTFECFKQGRHIYTFQERCKEDPNLLLNDGATKVFLSTKGTVDDVPPDISAFLNYVDNGTVASKFVEELDNAVIAVKSNQKVRHDFMTFQMALLEKEIETEERVRNEEREAVATKLIRKGFSTADISEITDLPKEKIQQLVEINCGN